MVLCDYICGYMSTDGDLNILNSTINHYNIRKIILSEDSVSGISLSIIKKSSNYVMRRKY